ncbi:MAG TPA: hypothetical protein VIW29_05025 [Polyangiaceae bacterium]
MKRLVILLCSWALFLLSAPAMAAPRACTTAADCFGPGEVCTDSICQAQACGNDVECGTGRRCVATHCVSACTSDAECPSGHGCFNGEACLPVTDITLPDDYGIHASGQPTCGSDGDCQANVDCITPMSGGAAHCRIIQSAAGAPVTFAGCGNANFTSGLSCPSVSGYGCGPLEGGTPATQQAFCESAATCSTRQECIDAYPVQAAQNLSCVVGRCTNRCSSTQPCTDPNRSICFESAAGLGSLGVCVAATFTARLFTYHLGRLNPDPAASALSGQKNLVFLSDGFLADNLSAFSSYASRELARVTDNIDVVSPLFASLYNLFILQIADRASGLGQPTRFGHFLSLNNTTGDLPGARAQTFLFANHALAVYSGRLGVAATTGLARPVLFFNADRFTRAYGGSLIVQPITEDRPHTLTHEFGHMLAGLTDEYVQDNDVDARRRLREFEAEGTGTTEACSYNVISRRLLTGCNRCSGSDDVTVPIASTQLAQTPWFPFLNESSALAGNFSTTSDAPDKTNGLFIGAGAAFATEWIRPNIRSFMRSQEESGAQFFGRASVEGWGRANIPSGEAGTVRWMPVLAPEPTPLSNGPLQALAVSSKFHRSFYTMRPNNADDLLAVVSGLTLALEKTLTLPRAPGADTPRVLLVDDAHDRLVMRSRSTTTPAESELLFVDTSALTVSSIVVPDLFGFPGVDPASGAVYVQTRNDADEASLVKIENNAVSAIDAPVSQPFFSAVPLVSMSESLLLLTAGAGVIDNSFCNATSCEIWAVDLAAQALLPGRLSVSMVGEQVPPAIQQATIGRRADGSEILIVGTTTHLRGYELADLGAALRAGNSMTPTWEISHTMGANAVPLAGLAFVPGAVSEHIVLGNRGGQLSIYDVAGGTPETVVFAQHRPGMQILGVQPAPADGVSAGFAVVTSAAFDGARFGFMAVIDVATPSAMLPPGRGRVLFEQPLAAAGLSAPGAAWDDDWGLIYTTGVVDAGTPGQGNRFRTPVLRGPAALRYRGCLGATL